MIWNDERARKQNQASLATALAQDVLDQCPSLRSVDSNIMTEIATATASYCMDVEHGEVLPQTYTNFLLARGMHALGNHEHADEILEKSTTANTGELLKPMVRSRCDALLAWRMVSSRLMRNEKWVARYEDNVYVIDLEKLTWCDDALLELELFPAFRHVIEQASSVFEDESGRGVLAVKGLKVHLRTIAQKGQRARVIEGLMEEILELGARTLRRVQQRQQWAFCPEIVRIDL